MEEAVNPAYTGKKVNPVVVWCSDHPYLAVLIAIVCLGICLLDDLGKL
jgi:hypothetical protein